MHSPLYKYEITTDKLRVAVTQALKIAIELLEEVKSVSDYIPEEQAITDVMQSLRRYRDQHLLVDDLSDPSEDFTEDSGELVE